ncbi:hypothetical protein [Paraburkholderia sediminicola]|uniref:hypothetical protein n=1 Tax=Paraburkholderia sediminicola TaxID=458836 RepID=UPI0038BD57E9
MDMQVPRTCSEAKALGAKRYNTGMPYAQGHYADRMTANSSCAECLRVKVQEWRLRNPEKMREQKKKWIAQDPQKESARVMKWVVKNRDKFRARHKRWRDRNPQKTRESSKKYAAENPEARRKSKLAAYQKNPEKFRERHKRWKESNREKVAALESSRRAAKIRAIPEWADVHKINEFYATADALRMHTGDWYHVDHIVPLRSKLVCGLHNQFNLQILTATENIKKGNRAWPDMP